MAASMRQKYMAFSQKFQDKNVLDLPHKRERLTVDEVLNSESDEEQDFRADYPDSELESETRDDSDSEDSRSRLTVSESGEESKSRSTNRRGMQNINTFTHTHRHVKTAEFSPGAQVQRKIRPRGVGFKGLMKESLVHHDFIFTLSELASQKERGD
ncbi:hypothetical protein PoB_007637100 [Plakobranchus ocellatus]|uniref:Uncharacterized protein n=1 Tax=Plakobranchus ocellatus TaxID=259542 RepID=A0AAV4E0M5_9GAST|nr:hypothetical protein PoB_007637100 [Plakobranchus ocellatus]